MASEIQKVAYTDNPALVEVIVQVMNKMYKNHTFGAVKSSMGGSDILVQRKRNTERMDAALLTTMQYQIDAIRETCLLIRKSLGG